MEVFLSAEEFAKTEYETQVALGFFDGVHVGHRQVLTRCCFEKGERKAVALTFRESPSAILRGTPPALLTDNEEKARLLEELGMDAVIFEDFSNVREMSAQEFVRGVLRDRLRAKKVCCGYNYRFSKNGAGDSETLRRLCAEEGIKVEIAEPVYCGEEAVSSTAIRALLQRGEIEKANRMLGRAFAICGTVGEGNHLGTQMGFPTVNLALGEEIAAPKFGVYVSDITVGDKTYRGATNIGVHPTVGKAARPLCETFIIGYQGEELYHSRVRCELKAFLREEKSFETKDALIRQVREDIETAKRGLCSRVYEKAAW